MRSRVAARQDRADSTPGGPFRARYEPRGSGMADLPGEALARRAGTARRGPTSAQVWHDRAMTDQARDELLRAATVGELRPHDAPVVLAEYDPGWPALYEREAARIQGALGQRVRLLEHVGSTAVPGLAAKPL